MQCGGGVRDLESIMELFAAGASEVVLGTKAIEDRDWLETAAKLYPNRLIVAADQTGFKFQRSRGENGAALFSVVDTGPGVPVERRAAALPGRG